MLKNDSKQEKNSNKKLVTLTWKNIFVKFPSKLNYIEKIKKGRVQDIRNDKHIIKNGNY